MERIHVFTLELWHAPSNLAKLGTLLSRRRLRAERFEYGAGTDPSRDTAVIAIRCDAPTALTLERNLERLVELVDVSTHIELDPRHADEAAALPVDDAVAIQPVDRASA